MLHEAPLTNLSDDERNSPLWKRLSAHLNGRLQDLRVQNDSMMVEVDRCLHLGRIAEVKSLLRLGDKLPAVD